MHVSFLPKEHDVTKALHGVVGSDVVVTWAAKHNVIIKGVERAFAHGGGVPNF